MKLFEELERENQQFEQIIKGKLEFLDSNDYTQTTSYESKLPFNETVDLVDYLQDKCPLIVANARFEYGEITYVYITFSDKAVEYFNKHLDESDNVEIDEDFARGYGLDLDKLELDDDDFDFDDEELEELNDELFNEEIKQNIEKENETMERKEYQNHKIEGHLDYWLVDNEIEICKSNGTIFWTHSSNKSGDFPQWAFKVRDELLALENEPLGKTVEQIEQENEDTEETVFCEECGEEIPKSKAVELDGNYYCQECAEHYYQCDCCGYWTHESKLTEVQGGDCVCEHCLDNYYSCCENCGEYIDNDSIIQVIGRNDQYEYMCESCADELCFQCSGTGNFYMERYHTSYDVDGNTYCEDYCDENFYWCSECGEYHRYESDCPYYEDDEDDDYYGNSKYDYNNRVRDYHNAPNIRFFGLNDRRRKYKPNTKACIGIELEVDRDGSDSEAQQESINEILDLVDYENKELYFEHDGSLDYGYEIITQPHTIESLYKIKWKEIFDVLIEHGYTSHDAKTCGTHFHYSRDFFGTTKKEQDRAISKLLIFFDSNYNEILKVSRRNIEEATRWADKTFTASINDSIDKKRMIESYKKETKKNKYDINRYKAVNLKNDATIEYRIMRGTLNYNTFLATIDFLYRISMNAKHITYKNIADNRLWLKGINENTKAYLRKRNAFLNVIGEQE